VHQRPTRGGDRDRSGDQHRTTDGHACQRDPGSGDERPPPTGRGGDSNSPGGRDNQSGNGTGGSGSGSGSGGAGTHPGGGVMGAPGRNAAAEILHDLSLGVKHMSPAHDVV
jgi:hypothetical protein